ncbi:MAG: PhzF family phenazine biosynthesis isomerase [Steroidobacterales bacterium]
MSQRVRVFQVDAFTRQRFCGNPAGVVLEADALSDHDMQALSRELNNGDTAFLLRPDAADHDLRVRFFTPRTEAAFVGHATLAAHAVLAALRLEPRRRQKQKSGVVEVDTLDTAPPRISIRQAAPSLGRRIEPQQLDALLDALALERADLDARCPAMIAGHGSTRLLLGVAAGEVLGRVRPDLPRLRALSAQLGAPGYFLFTLQPSRPSVLSESRMFCPALGIDEDPVSGNAHALLGAYLLHHGLIAPAAVRSTHSETVEFSGAQGDFLGRTGRVSVALRLEQGILRSVSIIGEAVIVFATELEF